MTKFVKSSSHSRPSVSDAEASETGSADTSEVRTVFQSTDTVSAAEADCRRWVSCLSHEIRNPLTLIYSSLQILEKDYPCVCDSPFWEQTKDDIQYLIRLLKDSCAATREYQPAFTVFSAEDFFQELLLSAHPLLEEHHIRLESRVEGTGADGLLIRADRTRLREALTNLLINAVDALSSMPDSRVRRILLTAALSGTKCSGTGDLPCHRTQRTDITANTLSDIAESTGDVICLHVKDNGPGIPDEYLDTLFDPFVTHKANGTGLGLSIVRNVVRMHGGTVSVETGTDGEDSFTDFCLRIPAAAEQP